MVCGVCLPPPHRLPKAVVSTNGVEKALVDAAVPVGGHGSGDPQMYRKTLFGLISGFHRSVEEICVILEFYAA
jgi:hypothetical protein